ncbi:MAG: hypothetical protein WBC33_02590 [Conexibacter sp.]
MDASSTCAVTGALRRDETILRLGGIGDCWHMSWAADDRQFVSFCDGAGFDAQPQRFFNNRMCTITGGPADARFEDLPGYPDLVQDEVPRMEQGMTRYYGMGTLAIDGRVYLFLSAFKGPWGIDTPGLRFVGVKAIYSPDGGRTWCNQDGSSPVVWERWEQMSRDTMLFLEEPQEAFSILTVLQMGKGYEANRDAYVYVYAPNGNSDGTMNELVMFRVPKQRILDRDAYEYFAGLQADGSASWSGDIDARAPIHTFPRGWVNTVTHPWAWSPSVVYNAPLGVYMMANWGTGSTPEGMWFGAPSYLGLWTAPNPWGPWTQVHEETAWLPAGDPAARPYKPQIAPKWIAEDGKSFWLVWTDFQTVAGADFMAEFERFSAAGAAPAGIHPLAAIHRRLLPYYAFNAQRVDMSTG